MGKGEEEEVILTGLGREAAESPLTYIQMLPVSRLQCVAPEKHHNAELNKKWQVISNQGCLQYLLSN